MTRNVIIVSLYPNNIYIISVIILILIGSMISNHSEIDIDSISIENDSISSENE